MEDETLICNIRRGRTDLGKNSFRKACNKVMEWKKGCKRELEVKKFKKEGIKRKANRKRERKEVMQCYILDCVKQVVGVKGHGGVFRWRHVLTVTALKDDHGAARALHPASALIDIFPLQYLSAVAGLMAARVYI